MCPMFDPLQDSNMTSCHCTFFQQVLEGRPQYIEMAGNLIPVTKSGDQLHVNFKAFRENRLPSTVKIRDPDQEAAARVAFMKEPKLARGEAPQTPICNLNIRLPDTISVRVGIVLASGKCPYVISSQGTCG